MVHRCIVKNHKISHYLSTLVTCDLGLVLCNMKVDNYCLFYRFEDKHIAFIRRRVLLEKMLFAWVALTDKRNWKGMCVIKGRSRIDLSH